MRQSRIGADGPLRSSRRIRGLSPNPTEGGGLDGTLFVADGTYFYAVGPDGLETLGMLFSPGFVRGVTAAGPGEFLVATAGGQVARSTLSAMLSRPRQRCHADK